MRASDSLSRGPGRLLAVALWLATVLPGWAVAEPVKGDAALLQTLRKAQGMLRQLGQDKVELETANSALNEQMRSLQASLAQADSRAGRLQSLQPLLDELRGQNEGLRLHIARDAERMHEMSGRQVTMASELARWRRDNGLLVKAFEERSRWGEDCGEKNRELLRVNREMLERFSDRGFLEKLGDAEPLTGLGSVAAENARDDFAFRLEDLEVTPWRDSKRESSPGDAWRTRPGKRA